MPITVLIIDDETRVLRAFARNVRLIGYTVITAEGGRAGLELYHQEQPEVVITDLRMPDMSGLEVLTAIRAHDPEAHVILASGHGNQEAILAAVRAGAADFLPKPVDHVLLENTLQRAGERMRLQRELRASQAALREQNAQLEATVRTRTAALQEREAKLRALTNATEQSFVLVDPQGTVLACNRVAQVNTQAVFGTSISEGDAIEKFVLERDRAEFAADFARALTGETVKVAKPFTLPDGTTRWFAFTYHPVIEGEQVVSVGFNTMDITERQQAQDALRESEGRLSAILKYTPTIIYLKDMKGHFTLINRAFERAFDVTRDAVLSKTSYDLTPAEMAAEHQAHDEQVIQSGAPHQFEETAIQADGQQHTALSVKFPMYDAEGTLIGVGGISSDITERQQAEQALRASEEKYRRLVEGSPDILYIYSDQRGALYWSQRVQEVLGYAPADLIANPYLWHDAIHPDDQSAVDEAIAESDKGAGFDIEYRIQDIKGQWRWFHDRFISKRQVGDEYIIEGLATDITDRKRAQDALRASEEKYRALLDHIQAGVVVHGTDLQVIACNAKAHELLGLTEDQIVGAGITDPTWQFLREDGTPMPVEEYPAARVLRTGQPLRGFVMGEVRPGENEVTWNTVSADPVFDAAGKITEVIASFMDITARKKLEMQLKENAARYKKAQRLGRVGNWEYDVHTDRFWGSDEVKRIYGFDPTAEDFSVDEVERCIPERERVHQALIDLIEDGADYNLEFEIHPQNSDQTKIIASIAEVERDAQGNPLKVTGVVQDVTARKQMEKALRESERRHRELADNIPGAVYQFRIGPDGTFSVPYMSASGAELFERPLEELMDEAPPFDDIHPDDRADFQRSIAEAAQAMRRWSHEFRTITPTGKIKWLHGSSDPRRLPDGGILWDGVLLNITERKQAAEALKQHNRKLAELNAIVRSLTSTLSLEEVLERILQAIPYFFSQGHTASIQLLDEHGNLRHRAASNMIPAEKRRLIFHAGEGVVGRAIQERQPINAPDVTADPRYVPGPVPPPYRSLLVAPLIAHDQSLGALSLTAAPVAAFDDRDAEILRGLAGYAAIAVYNAQLYEQARQDAETKALLLHEVNHRVKNNLDGILGMLYIERRHAPPEALPAYGPIIEDLTQRIMGLAQVHQMLSEQEWAPLNLGQLAETIIQMSLQNALDDVSFTLDIPPTAITVEPGQAHHLALILSELTTNTLKHAIADRDAVHIEVQITQEDNIITLIYRNDGPGFPEEVLNLESHSAGLDIIKRSVRHSLQGQITLRNTPDGAETELHFKAGTKEQGLRET